MTGVQTCALPIFPDATDDRSLRSETVIPHSSWLHRLERTIAGAPPRTTQTAGSLARRHAGRGSGPPGRIWAGTAARRPVKRSADRPPSSESDL